MLADVKSQALAGTDGLYSKCSGRIEAAIVYIFLVAGATMGFVFAQMDRNAQLSRLSEASPNHFGVNFVYRMLSYGALPLLTLLASLVPDIGSFLQ